MRSSQNPDANFMPRLRFPEQKRAAETSAVLTNKLHTDYFECYFLLLHKSSLVTQT